MLLHASRLWRWPENCSQKTESHSIDGPCWRATTHENLSPRTVAASYCPNRCPIFRIRISRSSTQKRRFHLSTMRQFRQSDFFNRIGRLLPFANDCFWGVRGLLLGTAGIQSRG
ncbi:hypothetical protein CXP47_17515 [Pseudomonas chlororaphis]|nr:hypothetical protein CXP47_17515 [Pseudomonas chlororaphis]